MNSRFDFLGDELYYSLCKENERKRGIS